MFKTRLIATVSAVALSLAALSAPAFAATTMKHPKPPIHHVVKKVHHHYVSGKIVSINKAASMIKLSNGKTYRVGAKAIAHYKVGQHVRLRIS
jgi:hypothetical protein